MAGFWPLKHARCFIPHQALIHDFRVLGKTARAVNIYFKIQNIELSMSISKVKIIMIDHPTKILPEKKFSDNKNFLSRIQRDKKSSQIFHFFQFFFFTKIKVSLNCFISSYFNHLQSKLCFSNRFQKKFSQKNQNLVIFPNFKKMSPRWGKTAHTRMMLLYLLYNQQILP